VRNKLAIARLRPLASQTGGILRLLAGLVDHPGNFDDDLPKLANCDWVIEAVAENLAIKTALLARVVPHLAPNAVLTTNTSGLPVKQIAAGLASHRDRFFGTHFFNPPRYMRLLEVIPTPKPTPKLWPRLPPLPIATWATGGLRQRHAQLHRQPHRRCRHVQCRLADAGKGLDH